MGVLFHGMGEIDCLYFREPGGLRLELNAGGYRNYEPDLEPPAWLPSEGPNDWYQTIEFKESMFGGFPPADSDLAKAATDVYTLTSEAPHRAPSIVLR